MYLGYLEYLATTGCSVLLCYGLHELLPSVVPVPDKLRLEKDRQKQEVQWREYIACFPSLIHALTLLIGGAWVFFTQEQRWDGPNQRLYNHLLSMSVGYFLVDTYFGHIHKYNGVALFVHHIISVVLASSCVISDRCGFSVLLGFALGEVSNPFLLTKFLTQHHSRLSSLTYYVTIAFGLVFMVARVPVAAYYAEKAFATNLGIFVRVSLAGACELTRVPVPPLGVHGLESDSQTAAGGPLISATTGRSCPPSTTSSKCSENSPAGQ